MHCRLIILSSFIFCVFCSQSQDRKIEPSCPSVFTIHKNGGSQAIRYASNYPLNKLDTSIKTLLVYVHGLYRNAVGYFGYAEDMVRSAGKKKETLIIAPQYADAEDLDYYNLDNSFLYWKKAEWKDGHTSISEGSRPQGVKMSSYEVLDSILAFIIASNNFPNIKIVVIAGHSAGGQFVQRYSAITPMPDLLSNIHFRFIVMDPSSYMYPDNKRPAGGQNFAVPDTAGCPEYNHYPKGLEKLNTYAKAIGAGHILNNLFHRDINILLGENDTRTDDPNLDVTCAGNLQGAFRLERGENYFKYIHSFPEYGNNQTFGIVPNTGHNGDNMINSREARKLIFGESK